jgi:hypothetical protein
MALAVTGASGAESDTDSHTDSHGTVNIFPFQRLFPKQAAPVIVKMLFVSLRTRPAATSATEYTGRRASTKRPLRPRLALGAQSIIEQTADCMLQIPDTRAR